MLATLPSQAPSLTDKAYVYEPKVDGIRAIVEVLPRLAKTLRGKPANRSRVLVAQRQREDRSSSPTSSTPSARGSGRSRRRSCSTARSSRSTRRCGRPGFQRLQHRIHVTVPGFNSKKQILPPDQQPAAFIAFDLLRDGDDDLRNLAAHGSAQAPRGAVQEAPGAVIRSRSADAAIDRRRQRAHEAGARGELGGLDGQARPLAVSHREAQPGVDQAQAEQAGRVRRRRLDRSRRHARAFRIADPRRARHERPSLRRRSRHRLQRPRSSSAS